MAKIKVKNISDNGAIHIHKEISREISIDSVVADIRELNEEQYKAILKIAKQFRKADAMLAKAMPVNGGFYE